MSDFNNNKPAPQGIFPRDNEAIATPGNIGSGFTRLEEWMTPDRLKMEYLFGVPLYSPITKQTLTDPVIKNIIAKAASRVELECNVDVMPMVRITRQPFDRVKMTQGFNQIETASVLEVSIRSSNSFNTQNGVPRNIPVANTDPANSTNPVNTNTEGDVLYSFPLVWIDSSLWHKGIIMFVPLQSATNGIVPGGIIGGTAAPLFQVLTQLTNIPGYFFIRYSTGFSENSIPSPVNDLIGIWATMEILSLLGPTNKWNSQSIGLDGASQGLSGPGNQIYALRMQELTAKAENLKDLIKKRFSNSSLFMRHI
jgi:hypothetical protein